MPSPIKGMVVQAQHLDGQGNARAADPGSSTSDTQLYNYKRLKDVPSFGRLKGATLEWIDARYLNSDALRLWTNFKMLCSVSTDTSTST